MKFKFGTSIAIICIILYALFSANVAILNNIQGQGLLAEKIIFGGIGIAIVYGILGIGLLVFLGTSLTIKQFYVWFCEGK